MLDLRKAEQRGRAEGRRIRDPRDRAQRVRTGDVLRVSVPNMRHAVEGTRGVRRGRPPPVGVELDDGSCAARLRKLRPLQADEPVLLAPEPYPAIAPPGLTPAVTAPTPPPGVASYRGQTLLADGIAAGLLVVAVSSDSSDQGESMAKLSLGTYVLGAPIIHVMKGRTGHALAPQARASAPGNPEDVLKCP